LHFADADAGFVGVGSPQARIEGLARADELKHQQDDHDNFAVTWKSVCKAVALDPMAPAIAPVTASPTPIQAKTRWK
jgi:hypothetical protein